MFDCNKLNRFKMASLYYQTIAVVFIIFLHSSKGALIKHTFEVSYITGRPDGVLKDNILGINGQSPGPTIEGFVGDELEVTLLNKIQDKQDVTIHWHGIPQKGGSLFEDGTSWVSQCPLPYGAFQVYRFNLTQSGTFWYHSHVNSQYIEGLLGALIVYNQPESDPYPADGDLTLVLSDWYHRPAKENEDWFLSPASKGVSPYPDSVLINGLGRYPCSYADLQNRTCSGLEQRRPLFNLQNNATYRIRIINAAALAFFNFSMDEHTLETIEADGIEVENPVPVHVVQIAPGQRYSFLVRPPHDSADGTRYLIRSLAIKDFLIVGEDNINKYPEALFLETTAVLQRVERDLREFPHLVEISTEPFSYEEDNPPPIYKPIEGDSKNDSEVEIVFLNEMDLSPLKGPAPDFFDEELVVQANNFIDENNVVRPAFNNTAFVLPQDKPYLFTMMDRNGDGRLPPEAIPLEVKSGSVVQLVINNKFGFHPFHLHGKL